MTSTDTKNVAPKTNHMFSFILFLFSEFNVSFFSITFGH